jgi:hypothetical protein
VLQRDVEQMAKTIQRDLQWRISPTFHVCAGVETGFQDFAHRRGGILCDTAHLREIASPALAGPTAGSMPWKSPPTGRD